jgi:multidrug efflux system outer membrane protein
MNGFSLKFRQNIEGRRRSAQCILLSLTVLTLSGCQSSAVKYDEKHAVLPERYFSEKSGATSDARMEDPVVRWWHRFGSEELDALIVRCLLNNSDIRIANLQVDQARLKSDQIRSGSLPYVTAPIKMVGQSTGAGGDALQNSEVSLSASYRIDLWGEQRAAESSGELMVIRAMYERDSVERNVVASIANAYITYVAMGDSIALALTNEKLAASALATVEQRYLLGDATTNELELQRAVAYSQKMIVPALESQRADIANTIARLVGVSEGLGLNDRGLDALQAPTLSIGLPSRLLLRRPDIRAVEARMRSASANIEIARARLFPTVELSGQLGYSGATVGSLFSPQSLLINSVASIAAVVFDGGRRDSERASAKAYHDEMVETYRKVVLQAFYEVESAISSQRSAQVRLEAQRSATRAALRAFQASNAAYAMDAIDTASLLDARRNYQRSADDLIKAKADLLRAHVALAQAIGEDAPSDSSQASALRTVAVAN